jgi:hypothetical protein
LRSLRRNAAETISLHTAALPAGDPKAGGDAACNGHSAAPPSPSDPASINGTSGKPPEGPTSVKRK